MRKLLIFLMIAIPLVVILIVNVTVDAVAGIAIIPVDRVYIEYQGGDYDEDGLLKLITVNDSSKGIKLTPRIYPESASNKLTYWESSNPEIAIVDDYGNVSFVGFGTVNIYLTNSDGTKRSSCEFYVTDKRVHDIIIGAEGTELEVGSETSVWARVYPSEAVDQGYTLRSENPDILEIDEAGNAIAKAVGEATIIATANDRSIGWTCTASITIRVVKSVENVKLYPEEESLILAESVFDGLMAIITPEDATNLAVRYTTTDPLTATVSNDGVVTFHRAGSVVITVITEDGEFKDSINLTYTGGYPTDLIIENEDVIEADVSMEAFYEQIHYSFSPELPPIKNIEFISNNNDVAVVDSSGLITVLGGGEAIITIKLQVGENEYLYPFNTISIIAKRKIDAINFQDDSVTTASKNYKISPIYLPYDATDKDSLRYEIISGNCAVISEEGTLTFSKAGKVVVKVTDESLLQTEEVFSEITVFYTGGHPSHFTLSDTTIELSVDEFKHIELNLFPIEASIRDYSFEIISQHPVNGGEVISLEDGKVTGLSGGKAIVKISVLLMDIEKNDTEWVSKNIEINVNRDISEIQLECEEEIYESYYISAEQAFEFEVKLFPLDLTNPDVVYELSNTEIAKLNGKQVFFNQPGMTTLTVFSAKNPNIKSVMHFWYTGNYSVSATVNGLPEKIINGDSFDITLSDIIPKNAKNTSFMIAFSNQSVSNMFSVSYYETNTRARVIALASGSATISILVTGSDTNNIAIYTKEISVLQKVDYISFPYEEQITSSMQFNLKCEIFPSNASQREIIYSLPEEYAPIATITNQILFFNASEKESETVTVIATLIDIDGLTKTSQINITSTLGKITSPTGNEVNIATGTSIEYDFSGELTNSTKLNIISNSENVSYSLVSGRLTITALQAGISEISVELHNKDTGELLRIIENIKITAVVNIDNISISSADFTRIENKLVTAINDVFILLSLEPTEASKEGLIFYISNTSIADFDEESGILHFYKAGTVDLTITSPDGSCSRVFTIQYTEGKVLSYKLNIEEESSFYISQKYLVQPLSFLPSNANLSVTNIAEVVLSGGVNGVTVHNTAGGQVLEFLRAGNIRLKIQLSDGSERTLSLNVTSTLSEILFDNKEILTAQNTLQLMPRLLPHSATDKSVTYSVSDSSIATVSATGLLIFQKAGTVIVTVQSASNQTVSATCSVTSTLGYIAEFALNHSAISMRTEESREIRINSYIPSNATNISFHYEILSSVANDGSNNPVVKINGSTVTCLRGGVATIKVYTINQFGEKISQFCQVTSIQELTGISLSFDKNIDIYQSYSITSLSELNIVINMFPADATVLSQSLIVDNPSIAKIEGEKLIFLSEGIVKITATVNSRSTTTAIRYTKSAVSFELDDSGIQMINSIANVTIEVGKNYQVNIKNVIPFDLQNQTISFSLQLNSSNYNNLNVSYPTEGNKIFGENGGYSDYKITLNGWTLNYMLRVNVIRKATSISSTSEIKTPNASYPLATDVLPNDTTDKSLVYSVLAGNQFSSVDKNGIVTFTAEGTAKIEIKNPASGLSTIVMITHDRGAKEIRFKNRQTYVFIGSTLQLLADILPHESKNEPIEWSLSDTNLATISTTGLLTPKQSEGVVTVKAKLKNYPETTAIIEINIYAIVHSLTFDLKTADDSDRGIARTRVFGIYSATGNITILNGLMDSMITNQRTIIPNIIHNSSSTPTLIWTSSNPSVATVNNGVITVHSAGVVKISCAPRQQYYSDNPANPQYKEANYTFTFVEGINIDSAHNFDKWSEMNVNNGGYDALKDLNPQGQHPTLSAEHIAKLQQSCYYADLPAVLQKDIFLDKHKRTIFKDLYGNGYKIDLQFNSKPSSYEISITKDVTINNVYFRGYTFSGGSTSLTGLQDVPAIITIQGSKDVPLNIVFKNCFIDGGRNGIELKNATVSLSGCILQNAYYGLIVIDSNSKDYPSTVLNVKNTIMENSLLGCILNVAEKTENSANPKITFSGKVYMFNWQDTSLYDGFSIKNYSFLDGELSKQFKSLLVEFGSKLKTIDGKTYVHFGVLSPSININVMGFSFSRTFKCDFIDNTGIYITTQVSRDVYGVGKYDIILYGLDSSYSSNGVMNPGGSYTHDTINYYKLIRDLN